MPEIVIREAIGGAELDAVRELMRAYARSLANGSGQICISGFEDELRWLPDPYAGPGGTLLIALVDEVAMGCCGVKALPQKPGVCEMKRLWVAPEARGLGLGRRLVEAAIAWARGARYTAMALDTLPSAMPEANQLYRTMGFTEIERYNANQVDGIAFFRLEL